METDSKYVLTILKNSTKLEDEGFLNSSNPKIIKSTIASFRARKTQTFMKWVKGHNGHPRNEGADDMAKRATQKEKASYINLNPPKELLVTGAKLSVMTQKLAYNGILQWKRSNGEMQRRRTEINISRAKNCVEDKFGYIPTTENFWMSIRQKDLERKTREFLYLVTHDAHWTGTHWLRPSMKPELQQRAICNACGVIEDFDHILTKCESPGQAVIWNLVGKLWKKKNKDIPWRNPTIGDILGCCLARIVKPGSKKPNAGDARFWKILLAESSQLIWALRCTRVIGNEGSPLTTNEVRNKWIQMVNTRLDLDCRMTLPRYEQKALPKKLVIQTWKGTLLNEGDLPEDWTTLSGVLVGITVDMEEEE
ncbi:hypothetical protein GGU11DRAFT_683194 [Lentinula aff. detonsa]|nr:hypothetical protein GGU11DRAFT_683194 [Lentinula aff. detonsa]